jgi:hypothetical protein
VYSVADIAPALAVTAHRPVRPVRQYVLKPDENEYERDTRQTHGGDHRVGVRPSSDDDDRRLHRKAKRPQ